MHGTNFDVDQNTNMLKMKKVRQKREMIKRRMVPRSGVPNPCKLCDYQCNSLRDLIAHYGKEHGGEKIFKCGICKYKSNWPTNLKAHKESVHDPISHRCELCDFKNKWKQVVLEHKREKHGIHTRTTKYSNITSMPVKCDFCEYFPKTSKMLHYHKIKYHKQHMSRRNPHNKVNNPNA